MTAATTDFATLTGTYTIDPVHSRLGFVARHAMVTKVRGSFNDFDGSVVIDGDNPSNSRVTVAARIVSVDTRNEQRDGHLRTNDFFDAETYPELTFASTGIAHHGGNEFEVTGDLTIRGVTQSVTFPIEFEGSAVDPFGNHRIGFEASTTINRKDFGMGFNAALETGGVLVSEKITVELEVSAIKNA